MRVSLFVTCIVDQLWPSVGTAAVDVLRRLGCDVHFDPRQTCCGQPAFNTGYRCDTRRLAKRFIEIFEDTTDPIVCPSGSCTAMVRHYRDVFDDEPAWQQRADAVAARTHEFGSFLVNVLGQADVGASFRGRIAWHDACHGLRMLGIHDEPRALMSHVRNADVVELDNADACCGFGGTFSVKHPEISVAILDNKIEAITRANLRAVVSGDTSCLMQIGGRLTRQGSTVQVLHLAELLASHEA
jgi:L-lactate dehydrogenase complex protein LldE